MNCPACLSKAVEVWEPNQNGRYEVRGECDCGFIWDPLDPSTEDLVYQFHREHPTTTTPPPIDVIYLGA